MEPIIIAAASSYEEKYYLDEDYRELPEKVLEELHAHVVLLADSIGGIVTFAITEQGLSINSERQLDDLNFDEIHAREEINTFTKENKEFLEQLLMYHTIFFTEEGKAMKEKLLKEQEEKAKKEKESKGEA